jgi:nucleotide-binding universal stress UspA family protein
MPPHAIDDVAAGHRYLREKGIESEMKIGHGKPADEIVREATERKCEIVVMGTRGLGTMGRLLQGSVSAKVAKKAPCTVVIASEGKTERIEPASAARS